MPSSRHVQAGALQHATDLVSFWLDAGPAGWFGKSSTFDRALRRRFLPEHEAAAAGHLQHWSDSPLGSLALVLLLDQFPRNAFRGTPRMYATDDLARTYARAGVDRGFDEAVPRSLQLFFYLPFAHSEALEDQDRSVSLHKKLRYTGNAKRHRDIVRRFGRFPHRNAILGRPMTAAERRYLERGGFSG